MTSHELDAQTTATAWLIAESIKRYYELSDELFKFGLQIVNVLENPQPEGEKVLGVSAWDAAAAARLAAQIADRIRSLSRTLYSLLDDKKKAEND